MSRFAEMDRAGPAIPDDTCPQINEIQADVRDVVKELRRAARSSDEYELRQIMDQQAQILEVLFEDARWARGLWQAFSPIEKLRSQNEDLRLVGKYWRAQAKQLCADIDRLECVEATP